MGSVLIVMQVIDRLFRGAGVCKGAPDSCSTPVGSGSLAARYMPTHSEKGGSGPHGQGLGAVLREGPNGESGGARRNIGVAQMICHISRSVYRFVLSFA